LNKIRPNLWFDTEAEDAARFYVSVFKDSKLGAITHYPEAGKEITGKAPGSVMTVEFEISGQSIVALNGGPDFKFNEAISLEVVCEDQAEVDYYWDRLAEGGDPAAQQCG
jgi:predicted 3-demethylubiquinone-9 3-methyltransferase (glyoxalase superfamily)